MTTRSRLPLLATKNGCYLFFCPPVMIDEGVSLVHGLSNPMGTAFWLQLMGKIRGNFNTLERLLDRLEKSQREVEDSPARARL